MRKDRSALAVEGENVTGCCKCTLLRVERTLRQVASLDITRGIVKLTNSRVRIEVGRLISSRFVCALRLNIARVVAGPLARLGLLRLLHDRVA